MLWTKEKSFAAPQTVYEDNMFLTDVKELKDEKARSSMLLNDTQDSSETKLHVTLNAEQQS